MQQVIVANNLTQISGSSITEAQKARARQDGHLAANITDVFGPYGTWRPRNPYDLTGVYQANSFKFALYAGDSSDVLEGLVRGQTDKLHDRLQQQGVAHRYCRGAGTHTWPYWREDLKDYLHHRYGTTPTSCPNGWGSPVS